MHQVNQIFGKFGRNLLFGAVGQMEADMRLEDFAHKAVDATAYCCKQHQLATTVLVGVKRAFHGIELSADFAEPLEQFKFLAIHVGHFGILLLDNTQWGYSIYPVGV